jgi:hypothetical protein
LARNPRGIWLVAPSSTVALSRSFDGRRPGGSKGGWSDKVFARRYQAILVSEEEGAQVGRLEYLLSQGCKEGLVARPQDWPGVHAIEALLTGLPVEGTWYDRTRESMPAIAESRFRQSNTRLEKF